MLGADGMRDQMGWVQLWLRDTWSCVTLGADGTRGFGCVTLGADGMRAALAA